MKTNKSFLFKILPLFFFSLFVLTSCGQPSESPESVIQKFKEQAIKVNSGDISAEMKMKGEDKTDVMDFTATADFKFDRSDQKNSKTDTKVAFNGALKAADQSLDGDVAFNVRTVNNGYYIFLDKLNSTSEQVKQIKTVLDKYMGKWLRISDSFIPENLRQPEEKDEATLAKEEQLKRLFVDTDLFIVAKEYGVESVNGQKTYHYGIQFNENGVQDYLRKIAALDNREVSDDDLKEATKIISYVKSAELWIGVKDYYPYKAVIALTGGLTENDTNMTVDIAMNGSDYNNSVNITAPENAEEFNPLEVFMAYGAVSGGANNAATTEDGSAAAAPAAEENAEAAGNK
jgi:hypothetical protein